MTGISTLEGLPDEERATPAATPTRRRPRRRRLTRRAMRVLRVTHRWASLLLGIVLLTITTTGAILVLEPELRTVAHPSYFHATRSAHPITPDQAIAAARRAYPHAGAPTRVVRNRGVDQVALGDSSETLVNVDPGTGRVLGATRPDRGVLGFITNLHECGLTCAGYPGYLGFLAHDMPGLGIPGLHKVEIGSFILGAFGVILGFLVLSGVVLWWPGIRRWRRGFQVRGGKGAYARDYDLHKLIGVVALPMLGMWALTGANFELPVVTKVVDAIIDNHPAPTPTFNSVKVKAGTPDISVARAEAIAHAAVPGSTVVGANLPTAGDATSTFLVWVAHGIDPERDGDYAGNVGVAVDQHTGASKVLYGQLGRPLRETIWNDWASGMHFGSFVGWIPRLLWVVFGLTPLALAVTGVSTWLRRRRKGRRRASHRARIRLLRGLCSSSASFSRSRIGGT